MTFSIVETGGTVRTDTGMASLSQNGEAVTGWVGPDQDNQIPIAGTIKKDKLTIKTLPQPGRSVAFDTADLTVTSNKLVGPIERTGSTDKGSIVFVKIMP